MGSIIVSSRFLWSVIKNDYHTKYCTILNHKQKYIHKYVHTLYKTQTTTKENDTHPNSQTNKNRRTPGHNNINNSKQHQRRTYVIIKYLTWNLENVLHFSSLHLFHVKNIWTAKKGNKKLFSMIMHHYKHSATPSSKVKVY